MSRYVKLVLMELHRFWKIYAALAVLTIVSQVGAMWLNLQSFMNDVERIMKERTLLTYAEYTDRFGLHNFRDAVNFSEPFFTGPVVLCIAALLFYVFLIWYRDWFGKNTFAYRLLMLPTSRMNLFWSKLTAIMMFVLGLVALQIVLFPLHMAMYRHFIPPELGMSESIRAFILHHAVFQILIPPHIADFILFYAMGLAGVTVVFTSILLERSYRLKGLIAGIVYAGAAGSALLAPYLFHYVLYPAEIFWLQVAVGFVLFGASIGISWRLLTRKITV